MRLTETEFDKGYWMGIISTVIGYILGAILMSYLTK